MYKEILFSSLLSDCFDTPVNIITLNKISGGCINEVYKIETNVGIFLVKENDAEKFPRMFLKEQSALEVLSKRSTFRIPKVAAVFSQDGRCYMLMEFIASGKMSVDFWHSFAEKLAHMHGVSNNEFGWHEDNYIGSLVQHNRRHSNWTTFFIQERIEPQLKIAIDEGKLESNYSSTINSISKIVEADFPKEQPALLHGDLWSGNYLVDSAGIPVLIDPAIYFGHREMELAFTKMFGGFDPSMYEVYNEIAPLEKGFNNRIAIYNFYPLLVHVNLFGGSYIRSLKDTLDSF